MKIATAILAAVLLIGGTASLLPAADNAPKGSFAKHHPRRHQVNRRLKRQNKRITRKEKNGKMTQAQGNALRQNDKDIRGEERADAAQNGGHITGAEQKSLNQQENQNSQAIHNQ